MATTDTTPRRSPLRLSVSPWSLLALLGALGLGSYWLGTGAPGAPSKIDAASSASAKSRPNSQRMSPVVDVARRVSPAVVTIGTTMLVRDRPRVDIFGDLFAGRVKEGYFPYVGSGFIVRQDAIMGEEKAKGDGAKLYVMTNWHVVENSEKIRVTLTDGRALEAKLLDADQVVDVALLELVTAGQTDIPSVALGDSDDIMVGEGVVALGNPFGPIIADPHPTVTTGVISAVNRSFQPDVNQQTGSARFYENMIQTDASVNPGNSGGPLANMDGEVIAINTFIISPGGPDAAASAGVNFSIPINRALKVAREIVRYGKVRSIYMDFDVYDVAAIPQYLRDQYNIREKQGLLVRHLATRGPATKAGLALGDVILQVNGKPVATRDDLLAAFYSRTVGERLKLTVSRDGKQSELEYVIHEGKSN